ncbi:FeS assembly ATPase SufC [mine drainage metagenome]|uniref:FeS assembly ATPase SufC n=1 Tax=mine drainage metagenome TaxID=410659 RepID=T0ZWW9_9ZZZZ
MVAANINRIIGETAPGLLVITHYSRILEYMKPEYVHVMINGKIIKEGGISLIKEIEKAGYDKIG